MCKSTGAEGSRWAVTAQTFLRNHQRDISNCGILIARWKWESEKDDLRIQFFFSQPRDMHVKMSRLDLVHCSCYLVNTSRINGVLIGCVRDQ
jgi:hypothetical protein